MIYYTSLNAKQLKAYRATALASLPPPELPKISFTQKKGFSRFKLAAYGQRKYRGKQQGF